jgi:hypothetical protein
VTVRVILPRAVAVLEDPCHIAHTAPENPASDPGGAERRRVAQYTGEASPQAGDAMMTGTGASRRTRRKRT